MGWWPPRDESRQLHSHAIPRRTYIVFFVTNSRLTTGLGKGLGGLSWGYTTIKDGIYSLLVCIASVFCVEK